VKEAGQRECHYLVCILQHLRESTAENARLKAEVERLTKAGEWQPIETLPMFQEGLIVCEGLNGIYFGTRYKSGVDSSQVDVEEYKPTLWMPLPSAPAKEVQS